MSQDIEFYKIILQASHQSQMALFPALWGKGQSVVKERKLQEAELQYINGISNFFFIIQQRLAEGCMALDNIEVMQKWLQAMQKLMQEKSIDKNNLKDHYFIGQLEACQIFIKNLNSNIQSGS